MATQRERWEFVKPYLIRYRTGICLGLIFVVVSTALDQVSPWFIRDIVDGLICLQSPEIQCREADLTRWEALYRPLIWMVLAAAVSAILLFYQRWFVITASRKIEYEIRSDLFHKFQTQPKSFMDNRKIGDLMSHATNDLERIRDFLGPVILHLARMPFMAVFTLTAVALIHWKLALLGIVPVLILPFFVNRFLRKMHALYGSIQKNLSRLNAFLQDSISGVEVTKAYASERAFQTKFAEGSRDLRDNSIRVAMLTSAMWPLIGMLASLGVLLVVWVGSSMASYGGITLGDLTAVILYLLKLQFPLAGLGWVANLLQRANASADRLIQLYRDFDSPEIITAGPSPSTSFKNLELKNLSFRYSPQGPLVLKDIDLEVKAGMRLGIVGPTGSGKTTLLQVMCGIYSPPPGQLFLNGVAREATVPDDWKRHFSLAPQDGFLFSKTIAENILLGHSQSGRDGGEPNRGGNGSGHNGLQRSLEEAGRHAGLERDLPQITGGYQALLGERGINLSGGQRQRVGLARAMMASSSILCLDDTLSALDTETETFVLANLQKEFAGRTVIIVAHRYSAVKVCDHILFLEEGRIAEQGTHARLLEKNGMYAKVYEQQQLSLALDQS